MKKINYFRLATLFALVLVAVICLSSCSGKLDIGMTDDLTEDLLDLLLTDDYAGAYDMVDEVVTEDDFKPYWNAMRSSAEGATSYEIEQIGWNININNGTKYYIAAFEAEFDNGNTVFLRTTLVDGVDGIYGIYFNDITEFNATYGVFAQIANMALIVLSLLFIAFAIWMFVDCVKRKIKLKPLWLILIFVGTTFAITVGQQFALNFGIGIVLMLSSAVADPSILSVTLKVIVPVGAVVYFFVRKRLTVVPPAEQVTEKAETQDVSQLSESTDTEE